VVREDGKVKRYVCVFNFYNAGVRDGVSSLINGIYDYCAMCGV